VVYPLRPYRAEKLIQQEGYLYSFKLDRLGRGNWTSYQAIGWILSICYEIPNFGVRLRGRRGKTALLQSFYRYDTRIVEAI